MIHLAVGPHGGVDPLRLPAEREIRHGQRVDAHVPKRAGGVCDAPLPGLPVLNGRFDVEGGPDRQRSSDAALADPLPGPHHRGEAARPHALHQKKVLLRGLAEHGVQLSGVIHHRLLAEHVRASLQRRHDRLEVEVVRYSDVHDIRLLRAQHLPQVGIDRAAAMAFRECLSALRAPAHHRRQLRVADFMHAPGEFIGDVPRANDRPSDLIHAPSHTSVCSVYNTTILQDHHSIDRRSNQ